MSKKQISSEKNIWDVLTKKIQPARCKSSVAKKLGLSTLKAPREDQINVTQECMNVSFNLDNLRSELATDSEDGTSATNLAKPAVIGSKFRNIFGANIGHHSVSPFLSATTSSVMHGVIKACFRYNVNSAARTLVEKLEKNEQLDVVNSETETIQTTSSTDMQLEMCSTMQYKQRHRIPQELVSPSAGQWPPENHSNDNESEALGYAKWKRRQSSMYKVRTVADLKRQCLGSLKNDILLSSLGLRRKGNGHARLCYPTADSYSAQSSDRVWIGNQLQEKKKVSKQILGLRSSDGYIADRSFNSHVSIRDQRKLTMRLSRENDQHVSSSPRKKLGRAPRSRLSSHQLKRKTKNVVFRNANSRLDKDIQTGEPGLSAPAESIDFEGIDNNGQNSNDSKFADDNEKVDEFSCLRRLLTRAPVSNPLRLAEKISQFQKSLVEMSLKSPTSTLPLLYHACVHENVEGAFYLLLYGVNVNQKYGLLEDTALHVASRCGNLSLIRLLLKFGGDPTLTDINGQLPEQLSNSPVLSNFLENCRKRFQTSDSSSSKIYQLDQILSEDFFDDKTNRNIFDRLFSEETVVKPEKLLCLDFVPNGGKLPPCATLTRTDATLFIFNECLIPSKCCRMSIVFFNDLIQFFDDSQEAIAKHFTSKIKIFSVKQNDLTQSLSVCSFNLPFIRRLSKTTAAGDSVLVVPFTNYLENLLGYETYNFSLAEDEIDECRYHSLS